MFEDRSTLPKLSDDDFEKLCLALSKPSETDLAKVPPYKRFSALKSGHTEICSSRSVGNKALWVEVPTRDAEARAFRETVLSNFQKFLKNGDEHHQAVIKCLDFCHYRLPQGPGKADNHAVLIEMNDRDHSWYGRSYGGWFRYTAGPVVHCCFTSDKEGVPFYQWQLYSYAAQDEELSFIAKHGASLLFQNHPPPPMILHALKTIESKHEQFCRSTIASIETFRDSNREQGLIIESDEGVFRVKLTLVPKKWYVEAQVQQLT